MIPMNPVCRALFLAGLLMALAAARPESAHAANDFSPAEQAIFVDKHLDKLRPPLTLHYRYRKTGTLEAPFDDTVDLILSARPDGSCCAARTRFFTGTREVSQPEIESAEGNPLILYFLEREIREMERLTQGKANYFRKRIRMSIYQGAQIRTVEMPYDGRQVDVREITISPYLDDPNRARFEKLAAKRYVFLLSSAVPGGLYGIRTRLDGESADSAPLQVEDLLLEAAAPAPSKRQP
jgi:hypothetical protein